MTRNIPGSLYELTNLAKASKTAVLQRCRGLTEKGLTCPFGSAFGAVAVMISREAAIAENTTKQNGLSLLGTTRMVYTRLWRNLPLASSAGCSMANIQPQHVRCALFAVNGEANNAESDIHMNVADGGEHRMPHPKRASYSKRVRTLNRSRASGGCCTLSGCCALDARGRGPLPFESAVRSCPQRARGVGARRSGECGQPPTFRYRLHRASGRGVPENAVACFVGGSMIAEDSFVGDRPL